MKAKSSSGPSRGASLKVSPFTVDKPDIQSSIAALLFVADSPASPRSLADALGLPLFEIEEALEELGPRLAHSGPLQLVRIAGGYQLCTKPEHAEVVAKFLKPTRPKITRSQMEVLAIVAYGQPVTQAEIDSVRGVDSGYSLRCLAEMRLVRDAGRKKAPGRPHLWATTQQFLHLFNLDDLSQLPLLERPLALAECAE